jgi:hypothetical protein
MATTSQPGRNPGNIERCLATPPGVERTYMLLGREDNVVCGAFALRQRAPIDSIAATCSRADGGSMA